MAEPILRACPNCGGTDRYKDGKCKACVIARVKDYARRNKAARKEYIRQWRLSKIDEVRANDRNLRGKPRGSARGSSEQAGTACLVVNCLLLRQQFQILLLPLGSWNRAQKFPAIRRPAWESER